jgi:catalase
MLVACLACLVSTATASADDNGGNVPSEPHAEDATATRADGRGPAAAGVDVQIVDALQARYGVHPGFRSNHAKGVVAGGRFTPAAGAADLSRSPLFAGDSVPVTVRFSDAGGLPHVLDSAVAANPRGMSVKFHLPGGAETDIVTNALKFFTVATPEDFRDLQLANAAPVPPGMKRSSQLEAFLKAHPSVERANATLGVSASFADERYFGIDAFVFVSADGRRQPVRYILEPERVVHLDQAEVAKQRPDYLFEELPRRLAAGPVTFRWRAQLAAPTDQTKDPTQPWPDDRPVAELGTIVVERILPDSDAAQQRLLFTPGRLTDGIQASDDPLIAARDGAYAVSFSRRSSPGQTKPEQLKRPAAVEAADVKRP